MRPCWAAHQLIIESEPLGRSSRAQFAVQFENEEITRIGAGVPHECKARHVRRECRIEIIVFRRRHESPFVSGRGR